MPSWLLLEGLPVLPKTVTPAYSQLQQAPREQHGFIDAACLRRNTDREFHQCFPWTTAASGNLFVIGEMQTLARASHECAGETIERRLG
jgi:hypothetical protein